MYSFFQAVDFNVLISGNKIIQERNKLTLSVVQKMWVFKTIHCLSNNLCNHEVPDGAQLNEDVL